MVLLVVAVADFADATVIDVVIAGGSSDDVVLIIAMAANVAKLRCGIIAIAAAANCHRHDNSHLSDNYSIVVPNSLGQQGHLDE